MDNKLNYKEQFGLDMSNWPYRGEWDNEPYRISWVDKETGYNCLAKRGPFGAWCGYVAVSSNHAFYKQSYNNVNVDVHGDLTYANECSGDPDEGICHLESPGEEPVFWFGFDCSHCYDFIPSYTSHFNQNGIYRNKAYVIAEIDSLSKQLKALENGE